MHWNIHLTDLVIVTLFSVFVGFRLIVELIFEYLICRPKYPVLATNAKLTSEINKIINATALVDGDFLKVSNKLKKEITPKMIIDIKENSANFCGKLMEVSTTP